MSRSSVDFNFRFCAGKPCGEDKNSAEPDRAKPCIGASCHLYGVCDLRDKKTPWQEPVVRGAVRIPA